MGARLDARGEARVVAQIRAAEAGNLGEVRVHIEDRSKAPPLPSARRWFFELGMHRTAADTGVLLYVALDRRAAAVFAGGALHGSAEPARWQAVVDAVTAGYGAGRPVDGLCDGLEIIGELLRDALPGHDVHGNELPDAVSRS